MKKINKTTARKNFNNGITIRIVPSKMAPVNAWNYGLDISNKAGLDFDKLVNQYEFYNCNHETGYRCAYYVE